MHIYLNNRKNGWSDKLSAGRGGFEAGRENSGSDQSGAAPGLPAKGNAYNQALAALDAEYERNVGAPQEAAHETAVVDLEQERAYNTIY